jgi:type IV pilus assembly protein PilA
MLWHAICSYTGKQENRFCYRKGNESMIGWFRNKKSRKGFTLVELILVVALIAILTAIALPQFVQHRARGYKAALNSDLKNAYTASQAYFSDYPSATINAATKVTNFGYTPSTDVSFNAGTLTLTGGTIVLEHANLSGTKTGSVDNVGKITMP